MQALECAICMENLNMPSAFENHRSQGIQTHKGVVITQCNHLMHNGCMVKWLDTSIENRSCVACRQPALPLSRSLNYGFCNINLSYFEIYPLCDCNPRSIESLKKDLQKNPSLIQETFKSEEFASEKISLLMYSVMKGYLEVTQMLINAKADVNQSYPTYKTPLFQAIHLKCRTIGRELIEEGATCTIKTNDDLNLLKLALKKNHYYVIDAIISDESDKDHLEDLMYTAVTNNISCAITKLIALGVNVNGLCKGQTTFLHKAVEKLNHIATAELLEKMHNIDTVNENGYTALSLAVNYRKLLIVKTLIKGSANLTTLSNALHLAAKHGLEEIVTVLLAKIDKLKIPNLGNTIYEATINNHQTVVKLLLSKANQDDINYKNPESGKSIISEAAEYGCKEILDMLCSQNGADLNSPDNMGFSPLLHAVFDDRLDSVKILLKHGANPNPKITNNEFFVPTYIACQNGNLELVKVLFEECKKKINISSLKIAEHLYIAAQYGNTKIVKFLFELGAKLDVQSDRTEAEGATALIVASVTGQTEVVKLLLNSGANHSLQRKDGDTALHSACKHGHTLIVKLLLENGANPIFKNGRNKSATDIASSKNNPEIIALLKTKYCLNTYV